MKVIDIHTHPTLKPYGRSEGEGNSCNPKKKNSIWYNDEPTKFDIVVEQATAIPAYTQASFGAAVEGDIQVIAAVLYPPEVGFFKDKLGKGWLSRNTASLVTGLPAKEIRNFQKDDYSYWEYVSGEYKFLTELNGQKVTLEDGKEYQYKIVKSFEELEATAQLENTLVVFVSVEGGHSYGDRVLTPEAPADEKYNKAVLDHIQEVKNWEYPPMYQTFCHHFYNGLCGHTESFPPGPAANLLDQQYGINTGITELGYEAIDLFLNTDKGARVLIDSKHMSVQGRQEWYKLIETKYASENIPVIYSHAGVNGRPSLWDPEKKSEAEDDFNDWSINLFDDEIVFLAKTNGIIGLEMDRRIASSKDELKEAQKEGRKTKDKDLEWSELLFNQIKHIAEVLDKAGMNAWDNTALGSDYDGIINPIYGFWTSADMQDLAAALKRHLTAYMADCMLSADNLLEVDEILEKIFHDNAYSFLKTHFKAPVAALA